MGLISKSILWAILFFFVVRGDPVEDKQALQDFLLNISHSRHLNWDNNTPACRGWTGVTCNSDESRIVALRLPGFGFRGHIPSNTLSRLLGLQILSLRSNLISGSFPSDFAKLGNLTSIYLQSNRFTGPLPSDFSVWKSLSVIDLSGNAFNDSIPSSISNLTHLIALNLSNNSLSGKVPNLNVPSLQQLDLSNNNLTGTVPKSLERFPSGAFSGNNLSAETSPSPSPSPPPGFPPTAQPSRKSVKLSEPAVLGITIGACVLGFVMLALVMVVCCSNRETKNQVFVKSKEGMPMKKKVVSEEQQGNGKLVFFGDARSSNLAFDLEDLLMASAEVLGKGTFGITYKAALEDATTVVVKRLKDVNAAKREFEQQMQVIGSIEHENVATLRAYYYSKDEKLVVNDYYREGSVSAMLHAKRGETGRTPLDWETRLKIAIGAARGIAHIHSQSSGKFVHGNIKASNIFMNSKHYGCVSELGLAPLMTSMTPPAMRTAGYKAPEITDTRKVSQPSDIYSYGVLLLELLTGKSPIYSTGNGNEVIHLVRWVHSVVREEWTAEVFDLELLKYPNIEEEMVEMLQIALACASRIPENRPRIDEIVMKVEDVRRVGTGNQPSSSAGSTPVLAPPVLEKGSSSSNPQ